LNSTLVITDVLLVEVFTLLDLVDTHRVLIFIVGSFLASISTLKIDYSKRVFLTNSFLWFDRFNIYGIVGWHSKYIFDLIVKSTVAKKIS